jgi:hypothetical protein
VTKRVRTDVARDSGDFGDSQHHALAVTTVDGVARVWTQDQGSLAAFAAACFEDARYRHGQRHGGGLCSLAGQVEYPVAAERLAVVLDPYRGRLGGA